LAADKNSSNKLHPHFLRSCSSIHHWPTDRRACTIQPTQTNCCKPKADNTEWRHATVHATVDQTTTLKARTIEAGESRPALLVSLLASGVDARADVISRGSAEQTGGLSVPSAQQQFGQQRSHLVYKQRLHEACSGQI
jgi:hypothetical protein